MGYRAVLFDLFDTLVDLHYQQLPREEYRGRPLPPTIRPLHEALVERHPVDFDTFLEVMTDVDREFRESRYARDLELPTEERFAAMVERLALRDEALPHILTGIHMGMLRDHTEVPGHHAAVLAELRGRVRIGLVSNFSHSETAFGILDAGGLSDFFDAVVVSDAVGIRKPRPEIFAAALERLGVEPGEALHVGDSLRADVAGAAACRIGSAWLTRRIDDPQRRLREHTGARPDHVIADLKELPELL